MAQRTMRAIVAGIRRLCRRVVVGTAAMLGHAIIHGHAHCVMICLLLVVRQRLDARSQPLQRQAGNQDQQDQFAQDE